MDTDAESLVHLALAASVEEVRDIEGRLERADLTARWLDMASLSSELQNVGFLLVGRPPELDWSRASRLRLLQVAGAGVDPLFPAPTFPERAYIANARGAHADAVRDHVLALLLSFARELPLYAEQQRLRAWQRRPHAALTGKRLTLVGFGEVGRAVARAAAALGLSIRAVRRSGQGAPELERAFPPKGLLEALSGADFAVICVPLTTETRGLIDAQALAAMPPSAFLIDVSRGGVVDEIALDSALRAQRLAGAARDVFSLEPLPPEHSSWTCPRLVSTPHVAGFTPDYLARVTDIFIDNVKLVKSGRPPRTLVSAELEY